CASAAWRRSPGCPTVAGGRTSSRSRARRRRRPGSGGWPTPCASCAA
ncbi:MAG: hypothetical protein AVDCRST_MAG41-3044, partial [uncultured Corynebacteriales bacterium]